MLSIRGLKRRLWDLERFGLTPRKLAVRFQPLTPKPKPIFITSIPKSGTHLLERALCLHPQIYRPMVRTLIPRNIDSYGGWKRILSSLQSGELLVAHAYYDDELLNLLRELGIKIVFMVRDPRASVLSHAHYLMKQKRHRLHKHVRNMNIHSAIEFVISSPTSYNGRPYVENINSYARWASHPDVHVVRFEDLVRPATRAHIIEALYRYVGLVVDFETIANIDARIISPVSPTFRSGKIDEWQNILHRYEVEKINSMTARTFSQFGYTF